MDKPKIIKSELFQVLSIKSFQLLWSSQVITQTAYNMLLFILGVIIYQKTRSNAQVSLFYLTVGIPAFVFGIISGIYVDKFNKRSILLLSTFIRIILLILIVIFRHQLLIVFILSGLVSIVGQFFVPAEAALIPRLVKQELLLSANSLFTLTFYSAVIGGFVFAGPLLRQFGTTPVLIFLAFLYLLSTVLLYFLPKNLGTTNTANKSFPLSEMKQDVLSAISFIIKVIPVKQAMLLMMMSQAVISIFLTLAPGMADQLLKIEVTDASILIMGPAALGMIVGALIIGNLGSRFRKRSLIQLGIYASGLILIFLSSVIYFKNYEVVSDLFELIFYNKISQAILIITSLCFFILGFANSLIDISCNTILQQYSTDGNRGRIYGVLQSLISGLSLLPVIISGLLADVIGINKIIFVLGLCLTVFGLFASGFFKKLMKENNQSI